MAGLGNCAMQRGTLVAVVLTPQPPVMHMVTGRVLEAERRVAHHLPARPCEAQQGSGHRLAGWQLRQPRLGEVVQRVWSSFVVAFLKLFFDVGSLSLVLF